MRMYCPECSQNKMGNCTVHLEDGKTLCPTQVSLRPTNQGASMTMYQMYGPDVTPSAVARRTSRDLEDTDYHGVKSMSSKRDSLDNGRSMSPSNNGIIQVGNDGLEIIMVQDFDDHVLETMGKWAQSASRGAGEDIRLSEDPAEFLGGGLAQQSLEDIRIAFGIRGASRVLTHQLVRTRAAAFKQQSQRDSNYGEMPEFRMPESVWNDPAVRQAWIENLISTHEVYDIAIKSDIPYEDARYILPEGTTNFILCEYSLRTFMEMYAYRGCVSFQDEMVHVQRAMRNILVERHPYLASHILISCEKIQRCTFQGHEDTSWCPKPWSSDRTFVQLSKRPV